MQWLEERAHKATTEQDVTKLRWLDQHLGGRTLEQIKRALIDRITDAKPAQGCSNATVNRTLELLRAFLRKCVNDWGWLDRAPSVRMLFLAESRGWRSLIGCASPDQSGPLGAPRRADIEDKFRRRSSGHAHRKRPRSYPGVTLPKKARACIAASP